MTHQYNMTQESTVKGEEVGLWRSVIYRAIQDAIGRCEFSQRSGDIARRQAINWFECGGRDYELVCSFADIDSQALRDWVIKPDGNIITPEELKRLRL